MISTLTIFCIAVTSIVIFVYTRDPQAFDPLINAIHEYIAQEINIPSGPTVATDTTNVPPVATGGTNVPPLMK